MDRKKLEKLAWKKTHKDFKSPWNKGDCTLLHFVPGVGTSVVPISKFTDRELADKAGLKISTGKNDKTIGPVWHLTMAEAEAWIEAQAHVDPEGVARGDYYIDGEPT